MNDLFSLTYDSFCIRGGSDDMVVIGFVGSDVQIQLRKEAFRTIARLFLSMDEAALDPLAAERREHVAEWDRRMKIVAQGTRKTL